MFFSKAVPLFRSVCLLASSAPARGIRLVFLVIPFAVVLSSPPVHLNRDVASAKSQGELQTQGFPGRNPPGIAIEQRVNGRGSAGGWWTNRAINLSSQGSVEVVWIDDALPAGAGTGADGGDSWSWVGSSPAPQSGSVSHISNIADWANWSPPPFSGNVSHQSAISSGFHQHQYFSSPNPITVMSGGTLYAYIYIDPQNISQEVMLQWGTNTDGWEHRAYWGANVIGLGTDGTASRRYMGPLPQAGGWVRLEVPASAVGLEWKNVVAMAFTLHGGRANWDLAGVDGWIAWTEEDCYWDCTGECFYHCDYIDHTDYVNYVFVDDSFPAGAASGADGGDSWSWRGANNVDLLHQHYFFNASATLQPGAGDTLFAWVYLDPAYTPSEVMLQWNENGSWEHRAYWGANLIGWGTDGTASRKYMGPLPQTGTWMKLEIPASEIGLEGKIVSGMAFTLYGGRAAWDRAGKRIPYTPPPGCIASVPSDRWKGEYFNNIDLSGDLLMARDDGAGFLNFDFGLGSPSTACGIGVDNFSARWTRTVNLAATTYRFSVTGDDGVKLWVDGQLKIDKWFPQGATTYTADVALSAGPHQVILEYFESGGPGIAQLSWIDATGVNCLPNAPLPLISSAPRAGVGDNIASTAPSEAPKRCGQKSSD